MRSLTSSYIIAQSSKMADNDIVEDQREIGSQLTNEAFDRYGEVQTEQTEQQNMIREPEDGGVKASEETMQNKAQLKRDHGKLLKVKGKGNRELNDLEDNEILSSRLRSNSGRIYSSSLSVSASTPTSPTRRLSALQEETSDSEMCPTEGECCKGTSKLIQMISKLQESVDGAMNKITSQEILTSNNSHRIEDLQDADQKIEQEVDDLTRELKETKFQLRVVSGVVARQDQQIAILSQKILDMQKREMASNVVIAGILEVKQEKPIQIFNTFVTKGLEIQELIPANKAYRIGGGTNRPLLVELRHAEDKKKLFAKATKLKGKMNEKGGSYFLTDHLPEEMNEERRRTNELIAENRRKPTSHQLNMSISRGKLTINEEQYTKQISPPTAREILEPDEKLFDKADELDIIKGGKVDREKSRFVSYAVAVQDFEDIKAAHLKIRTKFPDATHISCAYRLPGANTPYNQDYVDDGEFGCGRTMLKVLKELRNMNIAVFMVRYFGGKHLGVARYDIFRDLAKKAVEELMIKRSQEGNGAPPTSPLPERFEIPDQNAPVDWNTVPGWDSAQKQNKAD